MSNTQPAAPYTVPKISTSNPSDWFVWFRYFHKGKWSNPIKCREGINRIKDLKKRTTEAEGLRDAREAWLKEGWNPIADPEFSMRKIKQTTDVQLNFCEAMDFALKKKSVDLSKKSKQDYRNILNITKEAAITTGVGRLPVLQVKRIHILELLETLSRERSFSNHRYNMYLGCIRSMFTTLETWTICEYNPAAKIPTKAVAESNYYASFTEEEKIAIAEHLAKNHYQLFVVMQVVYQTGIRPKEVLALKVENINLQRRIITLVPDLQQETTKTKFVQHKPITNELWPFIKEMYLERFPGEYLVFGSPFEPGRGNRGSERWGKKYRLGMNYKTGRSGAMRTDYLTPSPWRASRDTVTRLWEKLIKSKETGLGINKCLYGAKHTGADDKILAGVDLDALRNMYGHRSKQMTERYAKQIRELYNSKIIEHSPSFTAIKKPAKVRKIA